MIRGIDHIQLIFRNVDEVVASSNDVLAAGPQAEAALDTAAFG